MSNHSGSYLLNDVLNALRQRGVFELLGVHATRRLVRDVLIIGEEDDCNSGEILDGLGKVVGICGYCERDADDIDDEDLCAQCQSGSDLS